MGNQAKKMRLRPLHGCRSYGNEQAFYAKLYPRTFCGSKHHGTKVVLQDTKKSSDMAELTLLLSNLTIRAPWILAVISPKCKKHRSSSSDLLISRFPCFPLNGYRWALLMALGGTPKVASRHFPNSGHTRTNISPTESYIQVFSIATNPRALRWLLVVSRWNESGYSGN